MSQGKHSIPGQGIITMAFGQPRYLRQAIHLARSLIVTNPDAPRAIVTDCPENPKLRRYFHHLIPIRPECGKSTAQKTHLYDYSPFEETLFVDADCLALRPFDELWTALRVKPYGVLGHMMSEGNMWFDIARYCQISGRKEIPRFNGGVYYFNRSATAESVARRAMAISRNLDSMAPQLGIPSADVSRGNDEASVCLSLVEHNLTCVEDYDVRRQIGPLQLAVGRVDCDIPRHRFRCETPQATYHSFVAHFFWNWDRGFHYQRETCKLRWIADHHLPRRLVSTLINAIWNPGYFLFTQTYRTIRHLRNSSVRIPAMTCWPYSHFGGGWRARLSQGGKA